jgi:hypothetical protein
MTRRQRAAPAYDDLGEFGPLELASMIVAGQRRLKAIMRLYDYRRWRQERDPDAYRAWLQKHYPEPRRVSSCESPLPGSLPRATRHATDSMTI